MKYVAACLTLALLLGSGCPGADSDGDGQNTLMIFHNGSGPMCLAALDWLETMQAEYPQLVVEEHLTTSLTEMVLLQQMRAEYGESQGVSTSFGYLPIIFFQGQAFSGFDDTVADALAQLIASQS